MDSFINYFSEIPSTHRALILIFGITFFMLLETFMPLFSGKYNRWKHTWQNIFFTLTTIVVNFTMASLLVFSAHYVSTQGFGLLQWTNANLLVTATVGLALMDLIGAYTAHYVEHKVRPLWQFHVVHHSDQHVDTTTANRHHPGESVIRFVFTMIAVWIVGAPMWLVFFYQSMSVLLSQFNHANITLPMWLNNMVEWVFVTPYMHRVHHHYRQPYSDMNYGNIFSIWDRIFGTYVSVDNKKLKYGVDTYMDPQQVDDIWALLKIPFQKYRAEITYADEERL